MKILLVEDDDAIALALTEVLTKQHYIVDLAADGQAGWELAEAFTYDLILLDVMLPKLDGISLCQQLRALGASMPILLLTSKNSSTDKVMGLDAGADDYVIKPFDIQELLARIRVLLRRKSESLPPVLKWEKLHLNPNTCEVTYENHLLNLTPTEYRLLELFLRNSRRVFSRSAIVEHLWSFEDPPNEETVNSHIKGLRKKLANAGAPSDLIETVYGLGYRLKDRGKEERRNGNKGGSKSGFSQDSLPPIDNFAIKNAPESLPQIDNFATKSAFTNQTDNLLINRALTNRTDNLLINPTLAPMREQAAAAMASVWEQCKESVRDRVAALASSLRAFLENGASEKLRQETEREAHKLAGALGIFGFAEGSRLAREIEEILQGGITLEVERSQRLDFLATRLVQELDREPTQQLLESTLEIYPKPLPLTPYRVLMIDDDTDLALAIQIEAKAWGVSLEIATDIAQAKTLMTSLSPNAVLLDLSFPDAAEDGLTLLAELANQTPPIPVVVFTARDSFSDRVKVARLGARAFLQKPIPARQVLEKLTEILKQIHHREAKVLVVDDSDRVLSEVCSLLEPWGMRAIALNDPRRFWDIFKETAPDLLILDVEMPHLSGIDLCQVVRNEPRWGDLPILFLSDRTDADTIHQLFIAGADDYVRKPIVEPELVTRAIGRLERVRLLRKLI